MRNYYRALLRKLYYFSLFFDYFLLMFCIRYENFEGRFEILFSTFWHLLANFDYLKIRIIFCEQFKFRLTYNL